jgi:molybdopterin molybdotransferase
MTTRDKAGCGHDGPALPLSEALGRVLAAVTPVSDSERLPIRQALGRVLGSDVRSTIDVPAHDNSAMDGYALRSADLPDAAPLRLRLIGTAFAGRPFDGRVGEGESVRIMTGAPVPEGADTVVMQERVSADNGHVQINALPARGANVRMAGEDIKAGEVALSPGVQLQPAHIGLLASIGAAEVDVLRRPRVAFFSTGDELCEVGTPTQPGQIYDSNRYTLFGMLQRLDTEIADLGVIRDRPDELEAGLRRAAEGADLIVTTGGVSVGEADYLVEIFERLGQIDFWSIAIKPGRPTVFGTLGDALYLGLPGNPVSAMATFYQLARPAILKLSGSQPQVPVLISASCAATIKTKAGRTEFLRGVLSRDQQGQYVVAKTGHQGSGILSSMTQANCFIVIPENAEVIEAGSQVDVQPFEALV